MSAVTVTHMAINQDVLEKWRTDGKVTKAQLARGLGISPRTLHRYYLLNRFPWSIFKLIQTLMAGTGDSKGADSLPFKSFYTAGSVVFPQVPPGDR